MLIYEHYSIVECTYLTLVLLYSVSTFLPSTSIFVTLAYSIPATTITKSIEGLAGRKKE
jgi:hypothetical protein